MSTYTDASLIVTPNAYKAGKLYSLKPTDGSGDLGVVRATTATYVDADGVIQTALANEPRFDHSNGSCPSILVEPQRTNLITNANGYTGNSIYYTITTNQSSPDGLNNAVLFVEKTSTATYNLNSVNATILPNTQYTYSFFVKYAGIQFIPINATDGLIGFFATFDALNGVMSSGTGTVQQYQDGWYRVSLTRTSGATANTGSISHNFGAKTGDGVSGFYLFGNQIEQGSNATSYIPTVASTVTRNADVISKTGISDLIGQTDGTIYFELDFKANNIANTIISIGDGGVANRMFLSCDSSNRISVVVRNSTGFQYSFTSLQQISGIKKISLSYKANDFDFFINGVLLNSSNSGVLPLNISVLNLEVGNTLTKENNINNILLFKEKLTNEQCIALTTL